MWWQGFEDCIPCAQAKVKELWDELWNVFEKEDHILLVISEK